MIVEFRTFVMSVREIRSWSAWPRQEGRSSAIVGLDSLTQLSLSIPAVGQGQ
jgi:hypothetical protein